VYYACKTAPPRRERRLTDIYQVRKLTGGTGSTGRPQPAPRLPAVCPDPPVPTPVQEDMAGEGKDYVPPLPKDVKELLTLANLAHLSCPDAPNPPHTSLMNFTFVADEEVRGEDMGSGEGNWRPGWGSYALVCTPHARECARRPRRRARTVAQACQPARAYTAHTRTRTHSHTNAHTRMQDVIVMTTRRDTKKFVLMEQCDSVSLLIHDFPQVACTACARPLFRARFVY